MDALSQFPLFFRPSGGHPNAPYVLLLFSPLYTYYQFVHTLYVNFVNPLITASLLAPPQLFLEIRNIRYTEKNQAVRIHDEDSWAVALDHVREREFVQMWCNGSWNPMMVDFDIVPVGMNAIVAGEAGSSDQTTENTLDTGFRAEDRGGGNHLIGMTSANIPLEQWTVGEVKAGTCHESLPQPFDLDMLSARPVTPNAEGEDSSIQAAKAFLRKYASLIPTATEDAKKDSTSGSKKSEIIEDELKPAANELKKLKSYPTGTDGGLGEEAIHCSTVDIGPRAYSTAKWEESSSVFGPQNSDYRVAKNEPPAEPETAQAKAIAFLAAINGLPRHSLRPCYHSGVNGISREPEWDPDFGRLERPSLSPLPFNRGRLQMGQRRHDTTSGIIEGTGPQILERQHPEPSSITSQTEVQLQFSILNTTRTQSYRTLYSNCGIAEEDENAFKKEQSTPKIGFCRRDNLTRDGYHVGRITWETEDDRYIPRGSQKLFRGISPMENWNLAPGVAPDVPTQLAFRVAISSGQSQIYEGIKTCTLTVCFSPAGRLGFQEILRNTRGSPRYPASPRASSFMHATTCSPIITRVPERGVAMLAPGPRPFRSQKQINGSKSQKTPRVLVALSSRFTHEKNWVIHPVPNQGSHNTGASNAYLRQIKIRFRRSGSGAITTVDITFLVRVRPVPIGVPGVSFDPDGEVSVTFRIDIANIRLVATERDRQEKVSTIDFWAELGADGNEGRNLDTLSATTDVAAMFGTLEGLAGVGVEQGDQLRGASPRGCWVRISFADRGDTYSLLNSWGAL